MMHVAAARSHRPLFIGSFRDYDLPPSGHWDGYDLIRVGPFLPLLNGRAAGQYLVGVWRFNLAVLSKLSQLRPAVIHASDIEVMPAALLYKLYRRKPVVFNIHDNLSERYQLPSAFQTILRVIEGAVVLASDVAVVPEPFRRSALPSWSRRKVFVVRNAPEDLGASPPETRGNRRVRLLYAGWLDWGRGIAGLLALARSHSWMEVQIAGEGDRTVLDAVRQSDATFLGFLSHREVMDATREADLIAAFYDPRRPINRTAAPNKLAEALSVGRPVIMNDELVVAHQQVLSQCTIAIPYGQIHDAGPLVWQAVFSQAGATYAAMCAAARGAYEEAYSWESTLGDMHTVFGAAGI